MFSLGLYDNIVTYYVEDGVKAPGAVLVSCSIHPHMQQAVKYAAATAWSPAATHPRHQPGRTVKKEIRILISSINTAHEQYG